MDSRVAENRLDRSREGALKPVASSYSRGTTRPGGRLGCGGPSRSRFHSDPRSQLVLFRLRDVGRPTAGLVGTGCWARRELREEQTAHPAHILGQPVAIGAVARVGEPRRLDLRHGEHLCDDGRFAGWKIPRRGTTRVARHSASANPGRFRRTCSLIFHRLSQSIGGGSIVAVCWENVRDLHLP